MNVEECIKKRFLEKIEPDKELGDKELAEAEHDLESARKAFEDEDFKWSIVKCYYSMFHAAKSVLFNMGLKERKHVSVLAVIEDLYKKGKIENRFVSYFKSAMSAREDADYHYSYSKETAKHELGLAEEFLDEMKKVK